MTKKQFIIGSLFMGWFFVASITQAATSQVNFDPGSGTLSVSGSCSSTFVLIVIRRVSDHSIWGSSDPSCVDNSYSYSVVVPPADRSGANFTVAAMDASNADQSMASMQQGGTNSVAPVTFTALAPTTALSTATITLDTSTLNAAPDDTSFLDAILQNCFGIVTSAVNSAEASIIAAIQVFAKIFTILPGGSISVPTGQNQISGVGSLGAGDSYVFIANTSVTSSSQIIVTPTSVSQVPLVVTQVVGGSGFDVGVISPQSIPISFTWLIIGTYVAGPPGGTGIVPVVSDGSPDADAAGDISPSSSDATDISSSSDDDTLDTASTTDVTSDATTTDIAPDATTTDVSVSAPTDDATSTDATSTPDVPDSTSTTP